MKQLFPSVIGNTAAKQRLGRDIAEGTASHAYIISGSDGIGKSLMAHQIAAAILCENSHNDAEPLPCGHCSACDRIMRDIHPDVIVVRRGERKTIGVDTVRRIKSELFITPDEAEHKFFIIEDAETMTPEAQNALLISLEEPPPFASFILLAADHKLLLETIRSRAQLIRMQSLEPDEMREFLELLSLADGLSDERIREITRDSDGIAGRAVALLSGAGKSPEIHAAAEEFLRVSLTGDLSAKARYAATVTRSRDELSAIISDCKVAVRDIIAQKKRAGAELLFFAEPKEVRPYISHNAVALYRFYSLLERSERELAGNASALLVAERLIMHKI